MPSSNWGQNHWHEPEFLGWLLGTLVMTGELTVHEDQAYAAIVAHIRHHTDWVAGRNELRDALIKTMWTSRRDPGVPKNRLEPTGVWYALVSDWHVKRNKRGWGTNADLNHYSRQIKLTPGGMTRLKAIKRAWSMCLSKRRSEAAKHAPRSWWSTADAFLVLVEKNPSAAYMLVEKRSSLRWHHDDE